ncbi:MAG: hypothetical protein H7A36_07195 [Chlamydiales bacterium]|nr:hypothetical protein [Chlamydiales bacterium]
MVCRLGRGHNCPFSGKEIIFLSVVSVIALAAIALAVYGKMANIRPIPKAPFIVIGGVAQSCVILYLIGECRDRGGCRIPRFDG